MPGKRTRAGAWIATCILAAATLIAVLTAPAGASSASASSASALPTGASPAPRSAAGRYWTADRMRKATPVVPRRALKRAAKRRASPAPAKHVIVSPSRGPLRAHAATDVVATVGQVYFSNPVATADVPAGDHFCTATAVNSDSKELVLTAGHCVHGGKGGDWFQNWIFTPGYQYVAGLESEPYGTFDARVLGAADDWVLNSNPGADIGMVQTAPNDFGKLVDVVGGMGLEYGDPLPPTTTVVGYAWNCLGFTCLEEQAQCSGSPQDAGSSLLMLACGYEDEATGAPWVTDFDGQLGSVNGEVSGFYDDGSVASPYYGPSVDDLFQEMSAEGNT